ncbi:MAG: pyruvate kinase [Lachnospiraceae bacterium]|nr:pyruvate kinase [Lachnospiraceae bacterium]
MIELFGTIGPSCTDFDILRQMFAEGMTGMRLNLSHTMLKDNDRVLENMSEAAYREGITPKLLIDLRGPELRIGDIKEPLVLNEGEKVLFGEDGIPVASYIIDKLKVNTKVTLDDGKITIVIEKEGERPEGRVLIGGVLFGRKSIYIEGTHINLPVLTDEDKENLAVSHNYNVTGIMQPFVKNASQLIEVRKELKDLNSDNLRIYAKIECKEALSDLEAICQNCDEIVIARGDLGNAVSLYELPVVQKRISNTCRKCNRDFMVVTQMLESMKESPHPTRAEVNDIFNSVLDGARSLMVTGETAVGKYPAEVIEYLAQVSAKACAYK